MVAKTHTCTILFAFMAGLLGGTFSHLYFTENPALAENGHVSEKVVKAQVFELTGEDGRTYARLYLSNKGPVLRMRDWGGSIAELWVGQLGGTSAAGLSLSSPKNESIRLAVSDFDTTIYSSITKK